MIVRVQVLELEEDGGGNLKGAKLDLSMEGEAFFQSYAK